MANKLTLRHIDFHSQKMKAHLALQIFSRSVADVICFLRLNGNEDFKNSEPSERFLRILNDLLDILNSRSTRALGFKSPLQRKNYLSSFKRLDECFAYIGNIRLPSKLRVCDTPLKTGIIGLQLCIKSVKSLFADHLIGRVSFFCTYRLCQDHIELLFNSIRRLVFLALQISLNKCLQTVVRIC